MDEIVPYVDILEVFNSRNSMSADNRKAQTFADEHRLLGSAVSDAHIPFELGRTYVDMPEFDGTPEGFLAALSQERITAVQTSPLVHVATTWTKLKKRMLA